MRNAFEHDILFVFHLRDEKITKLCSVIGAQWINANPNFDPDPAYELTTDNVKKIMAIHMRFRCGIVKSICR